MPAWIAPVAQALIGGAQTLLGGGAARTAQRQMEKMVKGYRPNASILDYYDKALSRYNANPYTSSLYNYASEKARAGTAQGIASLRDRRSALAGIPSLIQAQNDSMLRAGAAAEDQQGQALSRLGQATQLKAAEEFKPFEMRYNLLSAKAGGSNQIMNAGLSNIFGGLQSASNIALANSMYGDQRRK